MEFLQTLPDRPPFMTDQFTEKESDSLKSNPNQRKKEKIQKIFITTSQNKREKKKHKKLRLTLGEIKIAPRKQYGHKKITCVNQLHTLHTERNYSSKIIRN